MIEKALECGIILLVLGGGEVLLDSTVESVSR